MKRKSRITVQQTQSVNTRSPTFIITPTCPALPQPVDRLAAAKSEWPCNVYHLFIHMRQGLMTSFRLTFPTLILALVNFGECQARVGRILSNPVCQVLWGCTLRLNESANRKTAFSSCSGKKTLDIETHVQPHKLPNRDRENAEKYLCDQRLMFSGWQHSMSQDTPIRKDSEKEVPTMGSTLACTSILILPDFYYRHHHIENADLPA